MSEPIVMSWSGGKDSALALAELLRDPRYDVAALLTTVTRDYNRISMHGVRRDLLRAQGDALSLALVDVEIGVGASNDEYEAAMGAALERFRSDGIETVAFGDLFLADIRAYRERQLAALNMRAVFPVWGRDTRALYQQFVRDGFRAVTCCVDPRRLAPSFCGR